jgi:ABC-type dipeptide/oligopeptide/nickel transport system permease component
LLTAHPILSDLLRFFPATVELSLLSLIFGVCLGVVAATHRGRWPDQIVRFGSLLGYSMPVFWLGLIGLLIFYAKLGWVEGRGRVDVAFAEQVRLDVRAGSAHPVDPRGAEQVVRFARERSTCDPLNTLAAITSLQPFPPVRC